MIQNELVKDSLKFAKLKAKEKKLQAQLDEVKKEMSDIEERLQESFIANGVSSVQTTGGTVHIIDQVWPALVVPEGVTKDEARAGAIRALESMGHSSYITYNHQSMRGLIKDLMDHDGHLPPPLGDYVRAEIRHRIGVRGAKD